MKQGKSAKDGKAKTADRRRAAEANLKKILKRIEPFSPNPEIEKPSTSGKWCVGSTVTVISTVKS